ncbi:Fructose-bisphosphate aldolase [Beutenbergia cavernae DSM 12333]|uniref:Fructose-bisphosphate aldolase n=1 Tax=Beutenbergia cavernae (strain ATCC BAA-8 / DSM 12333 / CCUG 43141 / JCM 11478 / NBRC 16432 / NCIMB 13614 / HKI 0122) TaxID=471853 RepID=C5C2T4_BEUC1|nr:class II fructose-bisphosphate aldolase [Beutenbergia cavernae]ACQ81778.1 Fructose-bisphosphate aldolase [Beutenbergia cavernae DSM 12333]
MPLTDAAALARTAAEAHRGLGAFNVVHLETARVLTQAAEDAGTPVVLQISENAVAYHGGLEPILLGTLAVARAAGVDVGVHLDHVTRVDLVREGVSLGATSVMFDASALGDAENVEATAAVVRLCHDAGVSVEAELGEIGGKNGVHDPSARTDPGDAARYVAATGVDLLAVAVGSSHAMTSRSAALDTDLIAAIHAEVPVPLVLHGSSGVPDDGMVAAIRAGMTKINVATHLNGIFTGAVREFLAEHPDVVDTRTWFRAGNAAVRDEAARLLRLYAGV